MLGQFFRLAMLALFLYLFWPIAAALWGEEMSDEAFRHEEEITIDKEGD